MTNFDCPKVFSYYSCYSTNKKNLFKDKNNDCIKKDKNLTKNKT